MSGDTAGEVGANAQALIAETRRVAAEWELIYGQPNYAPNLQLAVGLADALEAALGPNAAGSIVAEPQHYCRSCTGGGDDGAGLPSREDLAETLAAVYWPQVGIVSRSDVAAADAILALLTQGVGR